MGVVMRPPEHFCLSARADRRGTKSPASGLLAASVGMERLRCLYLSRPPPWCSVAGARSMPHRTGRDKVTLLANSVHAQRCQG